MRFWMCLSVAFVCACESDTSDAEAKNASETDGDLDFGDSDDSEPDGDTGEAVPEAFIPSGGAYASIDFRLKEDSCGIDSVAPVTSLMPGDYALNAGDIADQFVLGSPDQGTETNCTSSALDPETGLAYFTCDTFREGYRSPYGDGFDMEVSYEGEVTEDNVLAGPITIVLHCMVGGVCDQFADSGVAFPCTLGGDLLLQVQDQ